LTSADLEFCKVPISNLCLTCNQRTNLSGVVVVCLIALLNGCAGTPDQLEIVSEPVSQMVTQGQSATFSVSAIGEAPFSYQWWRNGSPINGATSRSFTLPQATLSDNGTKFWAVVKDVERQVVSSTAVLTVQLPGDVTTFHNDNARTGQNLKETFLTPANVNPKGFGLVNFLPVDGKVAAQPLFLAMVNIPGQGTLDVLYVATEHDTVYAFDATFGSLLWQRSVVGANETSSDDRNCPEAHAPEIGITATPVIDRTRGPNGTVYVQAMTKDASGSYHQRLHALDVTTGAELSNSPVEIQASYPGTGDNSTAGIVTFDPKMYFDRAALLLVNGVVYTTWASHCDTGPYTGWIIGYDANTLSQTQVLDLTPNGSKGAIWMSGSGPAADAAGNIYLTNGNGDFDPSLDKLGFPVNQNFGNCFLKISGSPQIGVSDYFTMMKTIEESDMDDDLGSGGVVLLPDQTSEGQTWQLALGAGKDGTIYVVNRNNMGHFDPDNDGIYQEVRYTGHGVWSTPAYFQNKVYFGAQNEPIVALDIQNALLPTSPSDETLNNFPYPGATPSISAAGSDNAILWAVENGSDLAVLHAYDPADLSHEFYNSGTRDQFGPGNKFVVPTVANGRVYVGTQTGVAVFGLLQ
jgi:hypothetical protein